jgi:hypothetical protein
MGDCDKGRVSVCKTSNTWQKKNDSRATINGNILNAENPLNGYGFPKGSELMYPHPHPWVPVPSTHTGWPNLWHTLSIADLADQMLRTNKVITCSQRVCSNCDFEQPIVDHIIGYVLSAGAKMPESTSQWINDLVYDNGRSCPECLCQMPLVVSYKQPPKLVMMDFCGCDIRISHRFRFETKGEQALLQLRGVVYLGGEHFTSQIITPGGDVWYHDGIVTGRNCAYAGNVRSTDMRMCRGRSAVLAVYAQG